MLKLLCVKLLWDNLPLIARPQQHLPSISTLALPEAFTRYLAMRGTFSARCQIQKLPKSLDLIHFCFIINSQKHFKIKIYFPFWSFYQTFTPRLIRGSPYVRVFTIILFKFTGNTKQKKLLPKNF